MVLSCVSVAAACSKVGGRARARGRGRARGRPRLAAAHAATHRPCGHPPHQKLTHLPRATLWARDESPRRVYADDGMLRGGSGAGPKPPMPPPLAV
eukprot:scaffold75779_cov36-Phaeocystis_antarctica.AAC.1